MASAAPLRSEWTLTTSPRRTWVKHAADRGKLWGDGYIDFAALYQVYIGWIIDDGHYFLCSPVVWPTGKT